MTTTSSTNSSSGLTTSSIDVAGIVSQLMAIENKPLDKIKSQISDESVVISDLGSIKSKVSTFKDALTSFQNPNSYNALSASITGSVGSVVASPLAAIGNYQITVSSIAKAAHFVQIGYSSANDTFNQSGDTTLIVGGVTRTVAGPTNVQGIASWINGLNLGLSASVKTVDATHVALWVDSSNLGAGKDFTLTAANPNSNLQPNNTIYTAATDAHLVYNNTDFYRSSNVITDAINGVTINLSDSSLSPQTISVTHAADNSQASINSLISAYNDLITGYRSLTANANNSKTPGTFGNNPTMLSFVNEIKSKFAEGGTYIDEAGSLKKISLSELGIDLQTDGTLKFNINSFNQAKSSGRDVPTILSSNFKLGYVSSTDHLASYMNGLVGLVAGTGSLDRVLSVETNKLAQLNTKSSNLQDHLLTVQNDLTTKYSALNALLFQLSSTSNSLTSALNAITNTKTN
jgi:flagellar hook-associated protein 2